MQVDFYLHILVSIFIFMFLVEYIKPFRLIFLVILICIAKEQFDVYIIKSNFDLIDLSAGMIGIIIGYFSDYLIKEKK